MKRRKEKKKKKKKKGHDEDQGQRHLEHAHRVARAGRWGKEGGAYLARQESPNPLRTGAGLDSGEGEKRKEGKFMSIRCSGLMRPSFPSSARTGDVIDLSVITKKRKKKKKNARVAVASGHTLCRLKSPSVTIPSMWPVASSGEEEEEGEGRHAYERQYLPHSLYGYPHQHLPNFSTRVRERKKKGGEKKREFVGTRSPSSLLPTLGSCIVMSAAATGAEEERRRGSAISKVSKEFYSSHHCVAGVHHSDIAMAGVRREGKRGEKRGKKGECYNGRSCHAVTITLTVHARQDIERAADARPGEKKKASIPSDLKPFDRCLFCRRIIASFSDVGRQLRRAEREGGGECPYHSAAKSPSIHHTPSSFLSHDQPILFASRRN